MIKRLTIEDLALVEALHKERYTEIESVEKIRQFLLNEDNYMLAYIDNKRIVGMLIAYTLQRYDGRNPMLYLHEIDVVESHRKRGIGHLLMDELKSVCRGCENDKIFLITNKSNDAAVALYEKSGGTVTSDDDVVYTFKV